MNAIFEASSGSPPYPAKQDPEVVRWRPELAELKDVVRAHFGKRNFDYRAEEVTAATPALAAEAIGQELAAGVEQAAGSDLDEDTAAATQLGQVAARMRRREEAIGEDDVKGGERSLVVA